MQMLKLVLKCASILALADPAYVAYTKSNVK